MRVLTEGLIRVSEEDAVNSGAFSFRELMYRAGKSAADIIMRRFSVCGKKVAVLCGKGNNGGDGFVIADILSQNGADVTVITPMGLPATENAKYYYDRLNAAVFGNETDIEKSDLIIDALFGIGLNRAPSETVEKIINIANAAPCPRVSVDIPSGVMTDNGIVPGEAIYADLTVTFIALKPCFLLPPGSDYCGEVTVADIGVTPSVYEYETIEKPSFEKRRHNSHKGTFGTAVTFCGSYGFAGAAVLAAKGALHSGVGILKAVLCESIYVPFTVSVPEAVCVPVKPNAAGRFNPDNIDIPALLSSCNAVLIGCGMGNDEDTNRLTREIILNTNVPTVIDADGINTVACCIDIIKKCKAPVILTPHPGEMARLCGVTAREIESERVKYARDFAKKYGCILVLKGANTVVAAPDGEIAFNTTGNPGMSTGGSGDVLAGITVSLLAQGLEPLAAAKAAVYLHGEAGDKAAKKRGERAMLPTDLTEEL